MMEKKVYMRGAQEIFREMVPHQTERARCQKMYNALCIIITVVMIIFEKKVVGTASS